MDSTDARRMLQRLVDTGLVRPHGARGGTYYTIARRHAAAADPKEKVDEIPSAQPPSPESPERTSPLSRHGAAILGALEEPSSVKELIRKTGLTDGQVRYALTNMISAGLVDMLGAQGVRGTRYTRTEP